MRRLLPLLLVLIILVPTAKAEIGDETRGGKTLLPPDQGGFTQSLGMPPVYKGQVGVEMQWYRPGDDSELSSLLNIGLYRDLGSPVVGLGALGVEGYGGFRSGDLDGGGRAMFMIPTLGFGAGADYNILDSRWDLLLRLGLPVKRGGIFGRSSMLELRYFPTRDNTFGLGISLPTWGSNLGKTRARHDYVELDDRVPRRLEAPPVEAADPLLADLAERAHWIARMTQPFAETTGGDPEREVKSDVDLIRGHWAETDERFPQGHTLNEEIRVYHEDLDLLFSLVSSEPGVTGITRLGLDMSARARKTLIEDVLFPYNHLLGQRKKHDSLLGQVARAQTNFARYILAETDLDREQARQAFLVFQTLCDITEATRVELRDRWEDSRFVFLPLQFGLRPEDHDTQDEMDDLVARAAKAEFSDGNAIAYIMNEEFQWEFARSVRAAEDYHVLWIHDYRGKNGEGKPDAIAYAQTVNYLQTLIARVEGYDETGKLPVYMIFLDQHYFEINKGRKWLRLLREPLDEKVSLPKEFKAWEEDLAVLQDSLRAAVENSQLLRLERSQYGEKWLRNRIKVHINITNPADNSFVSTHVAGIIPVPDSVTRDHRKIAFYDVTEADPYRGRAVFTGMGIGEHYVGATWEDRALVLVGPEALAVKNAARELLEAQGFEPAEIPVALRPVPFGADYDEKVEDYLATFDPSIKHRGRVLQLHNKTGFADKAIDPAKAMLYSLMPPGSVLLIPDSLWQSYVYASLLAGSALRGCRVQVILPALQSAPSAAAPTMERACGLMARLLCFSQGAQPELDGESGLLKIGLYKPRFGVGDISGRFEQASEIDPDWARPLYRFDPTVIDALLGVDDLLDSLGYEETYVYDAELDHPKLHLKANLMASAAAWDRLVGQPGWAAVIRGYILYLNDLRLRDEATGLTQDRARYATEMIEATQSLVADYVVPLTPAEEEQSIFYLSVGSVNMDYRSMVLDGEVMILLSKWPSLIGMIDFLLLGGLCEWPETLEEFYEHLPPAGGFTRSIAGLIKLIL